MNVKGALTRKIGPLPAWGWGIAVGGALLAMRFMRGSGAGGRTSTATVYVPTGNEVGSSDFASQLGEEFGAFRDEVSDALDDMRDEIADIDSPANKPPSGNAPPSAARPTTPTPVPTTPPTTPAPVQPVRPPTTAAPSPSLFGAANWPSYARASLAEAQAFARRLIRNYSPGGTLYGQGAAGSPTTRNAIPVIPTNVLSLEQQRALARQYGGTLLADVR